MAEGAGRGERAGAGSGRIDEAVQAYIDGIAPGYRPLFDRLHRLILGVRPDAEVILGLRLFFDFDEWQESELRMLGVTLG